MSSFKTLTLINAGGGAYGPQRHIFLTPLWSKLSDHIL